MGMRADIIVRLQVNATRFQAGRYILAFCPKVGSGTDTNETATNIRFANLTTITQLPHVEIDLSSETEAILCIPYVSYSSHLPIVPGSPTLFGSLGILKLFPYVPVTAAAGALSCSYNIYFNFDNIHLAAPVVPQSARFVPSIPRGKNNPVTVEQKTAGVGPIEAGSIKVGVVANFIGDTIPALTAIAAPVKWASDLVAGLAHIFGWSKPVNLEHSYRVVNTKMAYMTNSNAIDNSLPMSMMSDNQVEVLPGFAGTDIDEMAIDYIKSIPAYYTQFTWTTGSGSGASLFSQTVVPANFYTSFASGIPTAYCYTPVGALTTLFNQYRGGIRYTFKIIKTEFHSGRVSVTFNPLVPGQAATTISVANAPFVHREIIDIREGNSFDFIVPYVSLTPYKQCSDNFGEIVVRVINPLIAPATVSSTIVFLVEVAGAPDFEVAFPAMNVAVRPTAVYNPQSSSFIPKADKNSITSSVIGQSRLLHDNHMSARSCVGEKVVSILSYLKRNFFFGTAATANISFDPVLVSLAKTTAASNATNGPHNDPYSFISSWYALSRGSIRVKFTNNDGAKELAHAGFFPQNTGSYDTVNTFGLPNDSSQRVLVDLGEGVELQFPQYNDTHSRGVADITFSSTYLTNNHAALGASIGYFSLARLAGGAGTVTMYRSVGDDFQLGYFVGIPPVLVV